MKKALKYFMIAVCLVLGSVFVYSALDKIARPDSFRIAIGNYRILSPVLSHYAAMFLPWLELYCGLFLIVGIYSKTSATILGFLLLIFIIALISALVRGLDISCGCFTLVSGQDSISLLRIFEDIILLSIASLVVFLPSFSDRSAA